MSKDRKQKTKPKRAPILNRQPPPGVKSLLRREVGSVCPVLEGGRVCGTPFLEWHHFDPEWHVEQHHRVKDMIALCKHHHARATGGKYGGAYTKEQFREFKANALARAPEPSGNLGWRRRNVVSVGGSVVQVTDGEVVRIDGQSVVWFTRDADGYLLLNIRMFSVTEQPRLLMEDNYFTAKGTPLEVECPPQAARLTATYPNGDYLHLEYRNLDTPEEAAKAHAAPGLEFWQSMDFPLMSIEWQMRAPGTGIDFGKKITLLPRNNAIQDVAIINVPPGYAGIDITTGLKTGPQRPALIRV